MTDYLCSPSQFAIAELKGFNSSIFNWEAVNFQGKVTRDGKQFYYSFCPTLFNKTGEFRNFMIHAILSKNGKILSETKTDSDLRNKVSRELKIIMPISKEESGCDFWVEIRGADGNLWKIFQQNVDAVYQPLKIRMIEPAYRNNIYASMPGPEIILEISSEFTGEVSVELTDDNGFSRKGSGELKDKKFTARIKADDLKPGAYQVKTSMTSANGEKVFAVQTINKLPFQKGEVFLDKNGIIRVEGNTFLPYGWFSGPMPLRKIEVMNVMQTYTPYDDPQKALAFLDQAQEAGFKVILYPYPDTWSWKYFDNKKQRQGFFSDEQREKVRSYVNAIKHHPAIFGWYMTDEPEAREENPEWYMQLYNLLKEIDPHHPCLMLNYGIEGMKKYYKPCDIIFPDCYPNFAKGMEPIAHQLWDISRWTRTGVELGRTTIIAPQAFCYLTTSKKVNGVTPNCRPPTFEELRNQLYQVFANNGKGVIWYSYTDWSQPYYSLRLGPEYLGKEISLIKDLLLTPNQNGIVATTSPERPHFQFALKKLEKDICLLGVNTYSEQIAVSFNIKDSDIKELYVLGENRKILVKDGTFTDEFNPLETHIYLNNAKTAEEISIAEVKEKIDSAEKSRFKNGNLITVGSKTRTEHIQYKINHPADLPKISASSDARLRVTRETGSLLFLLDGICESTPQRVEMSWAPAASDKNPYVEIKLVKPAMISEVKLYSLTKDDMSRLASGRVLVEVNEKWKEIGKFSDNQEHCVSIKFEPVKTQAVRITIDKLNPLLDKLRVLSEIEVYGNFIL